jgi:ribosome production factor 2
MAPTPRQSKERKAKQLASGKLPKARVARYLKKVAEPQLKESGKACLLLKGQRCSASMDHVLKELRSMKAPQAKLLSKKNEIDPFDSTAGHNSLEFLSTKNDCALFALASHNKKRPNNLVLGRTFNHQVLDLAELGVSRFKSMLDYGGSVPKKRIGSKPLLLFVGDTWTSTQQHRNLQNLLIDFYRGDVIDQLVVSGLDHVIMFCLSTASNMNPSDVTTSPAVYLHQRTYHMQLKRNPNKSATPSDSINTPAPYLLACGPDFDFVLRRQHWASDEMYKESRKQPLIGRPKSKHSILANKKNKSTNLFGETIGRLHLDKQDLAKNAGRKVKAIRKATRAAKQQERMEIESDLAQEQDNE